ncbi:helix-turn-helix transcriptional regulator [Zunongwangia profunda]|uniref:AraC family transcription regulator n=2 Tax=Zunongwangia profunda TaxID=398743 RepID=D5B9Z8_ZUNPS|nr:AraC family transcriptional regulator [Zunongwangia profunda]ADF52296.1 AraC family transcription regulator [Zunongwangia profunda SM-A87]MAC65766.1 AraC family transcriptional regulator [Flavobacteriaceae bacterium]MAS71052.1 AraC family transcriptional regulator [Zunongwangia sp.]HCV82659.1 AraC family transcriptional regulator [Zunongwangia profunda]|tara:strand:+ start:3894 stop:4916 length:1023 start_codon:yes stop_codon:yes gene_type:complete
MNTYHLRLNDVDDFVPQFAEKLGIGFKSNLGEFTVNIPSDIGSGKVACVNFPNGIGLYTFNFTFHDDTCLRIYHPSVNPIRFIYCVEGTLNAYFKDEKSCELKNHQHLIAATTANGTQCFQFNAGEKVRICYLEVNRRKFQSYLSFELHEIEENYFRLFADIDAENEIFQTGSYGLRTMDTIREIEDCGVEGFPRINYLGGKSLEVLSHMLLQFREGPEMHEPKLKKRDLRAIERAVTHINQNIANTGTVQELAKVSGINVNKLQDGFQEVYGKTVNAYIRDVRLTHAMNMLLSGEKGVGEVVYELGLSSRSYFSKIFKRRYGVLPKDVLNNKNLTEASE